MAFDVSTAFKEGLQRIGEGVMDSMLESLLEKQDKHLGNLQEIQKWGLVKLMQKVAGAKLTNKQILVEEVQELQPLVNKIHALKNVLKRKRIKTGIKERPPDEPNVAHGTKQKSSANDGRWPRIPVGRVKLCIHRAALLMACHQKWYSHSMQTFKFKVIVNVENNEHETTCRTLLRYSQEELESLPSSSTSKASVYTPFHEIIWQEEMSQKISDLWGDICIDIWVRKEQQAGPSTSSPSRIPEISQNPDSQTSPLESDDAGESNASKTPRECPESIHQQHLGFLDKVSNSRGWTHYGRAVVPLSSFIQSSVNKGMYPAEARQTSHSTGADTSANQQKQSFDSKSETRRQGASHHISAGKDVGGRFCFHLYPSSNTERKYLRPVSGFPAYGMPNPGISLGFLEGSLHFTFLCNSAISPFVSNFSPPASSWHVAKHLEPQYLETYGHRSRHNTIRLPRWIPKFFHFFPPLPTTSAPLPESDIHMSAPSTNANPSGRLPSEFDMVANTSEGIRTRKHADIFCIAGFYFFLFYGLVLASIYTVPLCFACCVFFVSISYSAGHHFIPPTKDTMLYHLDKSPIRSTTSSKSNSPSQISPHSEETNSLLQIPTEQTDKMTKDNGLSVDFATASFSVRSDAARDRPNTLRGRRPQMRTKYLAEDTKFEEAYGACDDPLQPPSSNTLDMPSALPSVSTKATFADPSTTPVIPPWFSSSVVPQKLFSSSPTTFSDDANVLAVERRNSLEALMPKRSLSNNLKATATANANAAYNIVGGIFGRNSVKKGSASNAESTAKNDLASHSRQSSASKSPNLVTIGPETEFYLPTSSIKSPNRTGCTSECPHVAVEDPESEVASVFGPIRISVTDPLNYIHKFPIFAEDAGEPDISTTLDLGIELLSNVQVSCGTVSSVIEKLKFAFNWEVPYIAPLSFVVVLLLCSSMTLIIYLLTIIPSWAWRAPIFFTIVSLGLWTDPLVKQYFLPSSYSRSVPTRPFVKFLETVLGRKAEQSDVADDSANSASTLSQGSSVPSNAIRKNTSIDQTHQQNKFTESLNKIWLRVTGHKSTPSNPSSDTVSQTNQSNSSSYSHLISTSKYDSTSPSASKSKFAGPTSPRDATNPNVTEFHKSKTNQSSSQFPSASASNRSRADQGGITVLQMFPVVETTPTNGWVTFFLLLVVKAIIRILVEIWRRPLSPLRRFCRSTFDHLVVSPLIILGKAMLSLVDFILRYTYYWWIRLPDIREIEHRQIATTQMFKSMESLVPTTASESLPLNAYLDGKFRELYLHSHPLNGLISLHIAGAISSAEPLRHYYASKNPDFSLAGSSPTPALATSSADRNVTSDPVITTKMKRVFKANDSNKYAFPESPEALECFETEEERVPKREMRFSPTSSNDLINFGDDFIFDSTQFSL